jgi:hypothetical protein
MRDGLVLSEIDPAGRIASSSSYSFKRTKGKTIFEVVDWDEAWAWVLGPGFSLCLGFGKGFLGKAGCSTRPPGIHLKE